MHGGASTGPKTLTAGGRYAHALTKWQEPYAAALARSDLLDLKPTLALLDVAIDGVLEEAETGNLRSVKRLVSLLRERSRRTEAALKIELAAADMLTRREAATLLTLVFHTIGEVLDPVNAAKLVRALESKLAGAPKGVAREVQVLEQAASVPLDTTQEKAQGSTAQEAEPCPPR